MGKPQDILELCELLPGMEWLAHHDDFDDGDTYFICKGRVAEYVGRRAGLVVREGGKEIGFIPVIANPSLAGRVKKDRV